MDTHNPTTHPATNATATATPGPAAPATAPPRLLADRNFRWLMAGSAISLLGDQCTLVALPWVAMRLSADTAVLGAVLALLGLPRALLILLGGAVVDRHSPQRVLMLSKHACTVLLALLAGLILAGALTVPALLLLAFGLGVASAFGIPSATSMLPQVLPRPQLQAANGLMMALRQLTMVVGPLAAGGVIAWLGDRPAAAASAAAVAGSNVAAAGPGLALAFALDAASFALSALTLARVRCQPRPAAPPQPVLAAVAEGLRSFWADRPLRSCLLYWAAVAVLISGPVHVAVPVLAASRADFGAAAFGALMASHGLGALAGMLLSGLRPRLRLGTLGATLLAVDAVVGLLFMPMGHVQSLWQGQALLLAIGVLGGYMQVTVFSWIQQRVAPALMGRAMSVFMFIFMGMVPLSSAATGWLMRQVSPAQVFMAAGGALVVAVLLAAVGSPMRQVEDSPPVGTVPGGSAGPAGV